jgi:hypothetical protein
VEVWDVASGHYSRWCFGFMNALYCGEYNQRFLVFRGASMQLMKKMCCTYNPPTAKMEIRAIF